MTGSTRATARRSTRRGAAPAAPAGKRATESSTRRATRAGSANGSGAAASPTTGRRKTAGKTTTTGKTKTTGKTTTWFDRFAARPDINGPRVRLGVLWFLVAMAATTAGRWWSGVLWAVVAAAAGRETVLAWADPDGDGAPLPADDAGTGAGARPVVSTASLGWIVAGLAASVPLAAAAGTGIAGLVLVVVSLGSLALGAVWSRSGAPAMAAVVGTVLPAVAAGAVVLVVASQLWAGLFLIMAVSLYDAGNFVMGAESSSRIEGPISGIVGVMAVTFTMATFQAPPFDTVTAWIAGAVVAVACPVGQWVTSAFLPRPDVPARAVRRLDAYVLAAPLFLAGVWAVS